MTKTTDRAALDQWYAVETVVDIKDDPLRTRLLGQDIAIDRTGDGGFLVREVDDEGRRGPVLPAQEKYGCLWTTLGEPAQEIVEIEEAEEADRHYVPCGWVKMRASGLRVVENFLDMAHFPFIHTDILGSEAHAEVPGYQSEIRRDVDEVWATNCSFFQPQMTASRPDGEFVHLTYRVPAPFIVMLYRACPSAPERRDAIALFIQPMEEALCRAVPVMYLLDSSATVSQLRRFEQVIFFQDRIIVENQRPLLMPLEPRAEIPTRADSSSVAYRRWLKEKGLRFGTTLAAL